MAKQQQTGSATQVKALGRPRAFCPEEALDAATRVFQRKGYDGASLVDLTGAMGINRPSCYAAFGDKEALFGKVLERYTEQLDALYEAACAQPTARDVAAWLLEQTLAVAKAGDQDPCLLSLNTGDHLAGRILSCRQGFDGKLERRFRRAQQSGDLPRTANAAALAALLSMTLRELGGQAVAGVSRRRLQAQAATLLELFPKAAAGKAAKHLP